MASKKLSLLLAGTLCLSLSSLYAQIGTNYDMKDSSLVRRKDLPQHNEFMNNSYPFPAKPRNQWEIGLKGGLSTVSGDVRSWLPTGGVGLHIRKALGYVFSVRGEYTWGRAKGLNFQPSAFYGRNSAWAGYTGPVFYNYRTTINEFSLQGVVTLNNMRFHKAKTGFNIYGFAGIGGFQDKVEVNTKKGTGTYAADFQTIATKYAATSGGFSRDNRKDIRKDLKNALDKSFETKGQEDPSQPEIRPVFVGGAGVQIKLSKRFNLAIEDKFSLTRSDIVDGQQWQENGVGNGQAANANATAQTRDFDTYNFASLGINYNLGAKSTEPLWWLNPLDYAYNEINAPRHMKLPKPVLDDSDGDGITDQFDLEPNTPQGAPVDAHGVSRDTDGDGVPDAKDKELITPTQCQPVDADGVGKCPEPACCKEMKDIIAAGGIKGNCGIGDLPSVSFSGRSVALNNDAKAVLAGVAEKLRNNPNCKVAVVGYGESSKSAQQLSWDRVNAVINYLVEKEGISADRFIFKYGEGGGDDNTVDLRDGTGDEGPNTVPAPHPNLRKK
jgi:outer membrane protein OmpA-like peptidoglycan-associated protein